MNKDDYLSKITVYDNINNFELSKPPLSFHVPMMYDWQPKEDITAFELSRCIPMFFGVLKGESIITLFNSLPEECKRHWDLKPYEFDIPRDTNLE